MPPSFSASKNTLFRTPMKLAPGNQGKLVYMPLLRKFTQGFKNVYHKEEKGFKKKFHDDGHFKKYFGKHDHKHKHFKGHKGAKHKGGKHKVSKCCQLI